MPETQEIVRLRLEAKQFKSELASVNTRLSVYEKSAKSTIGTTQLMGKAMRTVGLAVGALGVSFGAIQLVQVSSRFELLRKRLDTFSLSASDASETWERLNVIAETTPFNLEQVISGFATLQSVGLRPTADDMARLSDVAVAMGSTFEQVSNIIFKGSQSTELFQNVAVRARVEGEKIRATYNGVTTTFDRNAESIQAYLISIGELPGVSGAAERAASGITGALSNLAGNFAAAAEQALLSSGVTESLAETLAEVATDFADFRREVQETGSVAEALGINLEALRIAVGLVGGAITAGGLFVGINFLNAQLPLLATRIGLVGLSIRSLIASLGPVGLAFTALTLIVGAVTASLSLFNDEEDGATESIGKTTESIQEQVDAWNELTEAQRNNAKLANDEEQDRLAGVLTVLQQDLVSAQTRLENLFNTPGGSFLTGTISEIRSEIIELENDIKSTGSALVGTLDTEDAIDEAELTAITGAPTEDMLEDSREMYGKAFQQRVEFLDRIRVLNEAGLVGDAEVSNLESTFGENSLPLNITDAYIEGQQTAFDTVLEMKTENLSKLQEIELSNAETLAELRAADVAGVETSELQKTVAMQNGSKARQLTLQADLAITQTVLAGIGQLVDQFGKDSVAGFIIGKAVGLASIVVDTQIGVAKALALGPIAGPPLAALIQTKGSIALAIAAASAVGQAVGAGRQGGGRVVGGQPYTVGETGRETFIPDGPGRIARNGESMGGTTMIDNREINVNVSGNFDERARQQVMNIVGSEPEFIHRTAMSGQERGIA